jgi:hypothetical protein
MATPVTPVAGLTSQIAVGGTAVIVVPANPNGGFIQNPANATETLYVNPVTTATLTASGTNFGLPPGGIWEIIPGQTTPTSVNGATTGHAFSVVWY